MKGKKHKPETIAKMKRNHKGMLGKKQSDDAKKKIGKSMKGNTFGFKKGQPAWNKKTEEHKRKTSRDYYIKRRAWVDGLKDKPCKDCGGKFPPECMDFDHVSGDKEFEIHNKIMTNKQVLLKEIAKCEVVCSNCHRIRTKKSKLLQKRRVG